jgi:transcriptional regulator with XRE-family HTH domain
MGFSEKLKKLRNNRNMSQEQLAKLINVTKTIIWKYEQNKSVPSADVIKRMANLFNVTTDYLLFDDSERNDLQKISDKNFQRKFEKILSLEPEEKDYLEKTIDLILEKNKKTD